MTDEQMWYLPVDMVYNLIKDSFMAMGVSEEDAKIVADILIESDLRGIESHGVGRLYYYYVRIRDGQHLVTNPYYIVKETKTTAVIDANNGEGHVVAYNAMKMAIAKAKEYGLGAVAVRNATHFGIAGYYTNMATNEGLIGLTTTNARPSIPPTWSVEPMLGTNPLSWAMPTDEPFPFSLDCATSIVQRGKIEWYDRAGKPVPENLVIGNDGESLTDAAFILKGLTEDTAALLPVGGAGEATGGYKGYGYATVVELLSAAFSTAKFLKGVSGVAEDGSKTFFGLGHFFLAIDPEAFMGLEEFKKTAGDIMRSLRAAKLAPGAERIYTAGEKEYYNKLKVQEQGVPINEGLAKELLAVKKALNLTSYEFPFDYLDE